MFLCSRGVYEVSEKTKGVQSAAEEILSDEQKLHVVVEMLSGSSRRDRQNAAAILNFLAKGHIDIVLPYSNAIIDSLNRPEAQTRWECLDILSAMVEVDSRTCDKAFHGAEAALFDEESGSLRLAAMRFICKLGATTNNRAERAWPLIDEAIQCYHGDFEFQDMLLAVLSYSRGKVTDQIRSELKERMAFDAENAKGVLKRRSQQIIDSVSKK